MGIREYLTESSLSRLWKHNEEHDCGAISAFRIGRDCNQGDHYTKKENRQRNKSLRAKLVSMGYGVTGVHGTSIEGDKKTKEESFFVVDLEDNGNIKKDLMKLGEMFEQDSILFVPKGSIKGEDKAILIGTNRCPKNEIGYHGTISFNKGKLGYDAKIYTSYVNGRPFIFEELGIEYGYPGSGMGNWALNVIAKRSWQDIDVE